MPDFQSEAALWDFQSAGLRWTLQHACQGSSFYRMKMRDAGVKPEDIQGLKDIQKLPFTTADDLREGYPFPLLSVPIEEVIRIHASSGTTGKRKVLCYTAKDIEDWKDMFARCYEIAGLTSFDRVQIAVGYGLWTAGVGFQMGAERFGAMAVPVGPGNIEMHCEIMVDLQTTVFCCTASMGLLMAEEVMRRNLQDKIALRQVIFGAERHSEAMRRTMKEYLNVEDTFDIPGLTELYGPGTGLECSAHQGIHYWADYYILEIINPETLQPCAPGEVGEMVVTTLRKEAAPLIRYRTRDLTRIIEGRCPCGNLLPRHDKILGRSDDMFIIRGVNIYPGQIDHILSQEPRVGSEFQVFLERGADGKDYMSVKAERAQDGNPQDDPAVAKHLEYLLSHRLLVSGKVDIVNFQSLPRTERKSKRIFDKR
ncbi:MAG: phenylacetate--CoA ligase [Deltaproteobacteria bacterium]|nr:phenylacetate--CoA ligase [Deltaproteobacteria bacterium]